MQHRITVLNGKGDTVATWDPEVAATGDLDAIAAVEAAEAIFKTEVAAGAFATAVTPGSETAGRRLTTFDPQAEETVVVRQRTGG